MTNEQQAIVRAGGDLYIRACPGAGKTRTLIELAVHATKGAPRHGVAFLSFTNAAAVEVRARLTRRAPSLLRPPSFVGTFDSFLIRYLLGPDGLERAPGLRVQFRESWEDTVGFGVPLDAFVPRKGRVRLQPSLVRSSFALRTKVSKLDDADKARLERAACARIDFLMRQGITTSAFLRSDARRRILQHPLEHLARRFRVIVVDEAQDCDPGDLEIVSALRKAGCRCVVVADPEQGIFGFRGADPRKLDELGFAEMVLSGNFRSSKSICAAAASLRARDDDPDSVMRADSVDRPVVVLPYEKLDERIGSRFMALLPGANVDAMVVAHAEEHARAAIGRAKAPKDSAAAGAVIARALENPSPTDWQAARRLLEASLRRALGSERENELDSRLERWVTVSAAQVLGSAAAMQKGRACARVRKALDNLRPPRGLQFVSKRAKWFTCRDVPGENARQASSPDPRGVVELPVEFSTIHSAKGHEYGAVLVVIPGSGRLDELLDAWKVRDAAHEGRAVLYVAATRARDLLAFAVPEAVSDSVVSLLERQGAQVEVRAEGESKCTSNHADVQQFE
ncbi:MAG: ATP-dependent helicase [Sandaracinus sp.]|nr:ATP-dependent helicase [Sandaracinus sp.]